MSDASGIRPAPRGPRPGGPERVRFLLLRSALRLGPDEVTFRALAAASAVSVRMPVYVFGSLAGLHAAVALRGYTRLLRHLRAARARGGKGRPYAIAMLMAYLGFGLRHPGLWRAMHSRRLWAAMDDPGERVLVQRGTWGRGEDLLGQVVERRGEALREFTEGLLAALPSRGGRLAPVLALLADGFLFQVHFERVLAGLANAHKREWFLRAAAEILGQAGRSGRGPRAGKPASRGRRRRPGRA